MDCVFCRIIKGDIPAEKVYEDDDIIAILDVNPRSPGHTMVIPKIHTSDILGLPEDKAGPYFLAVKKVVGMVKKALHPDGFTLGINQGKVSGQAVDHLHFHIMPRFEGDGGGSVHDVVNNPSKKNLSEVAEDIRKAG